LATVLTNVKAVGVGFVLGLCPTQYVALYTLERFMQRPAPTPKPLRTWRLLLITGATEFVRSATHGASPHGLSFRDGVGDVVEYYDHDLVIRISPAEAPQDAAAEALLVADVRRLRQLLEAPLLPPSNVQPLAPQARGASPLTAAEAWAADPRNPANIERDRR
jgi:hypothetical protein